MSRKVGSVEGAWPCLWILMRPARSTMKMRLASPGGADTNSGWESPEATTTLESVVFVVSGIPLHAYWARADIGAPVARENTMVTNTRCVMGPPPLGVSLGRPEESGHGVKP